MTKANPELDRLLNDIVLTAYRQGWADAMTELRKVALRVRYDVPRQFPPGITGGLVLNNGDPQLFWDQ